MRKLTEAPATPDQMHVGFMIPTELRERVIALAQAEERSFSYTMRRLVEAGLRVEAPRDKRRPGRAA